MKLSECRPTLEGLLAQVPRELRQHARGGFLPFRGAEWPPTDNLQTYFATKSAMEQVRRHWVGQRDYLAGVKILAQWLQRSAPIKEEGEHVALELSPASHKGMVRLLDVAGLLQILVHVDEWTNPVVRTMFRNITGVDCDAMDSKGDWPRRCLDAELDDALSASPAHDEPFYTGPLINFRSSEGFLDTKAGVVIRRIQPWEWPDAAISATQSGQVPAEVACGLTHCLEVRHDILPSEPYDHQDALSLVVSLAL
jgi:hypothetical protein